MEVLRPPLVPDPNTGTEYTINTTLCMYRTYIMCGVYFFWSNKFYRTPKPDHKCQNKNDLKFNHGHTVMSI